MNVHLPHPPVPDPDDLTPWWPRSPPSVPEPLPAEALDGAAAMSGICIAHVGNWPTEENVAAAALWSPSSAPLLAEWKAICSAAVDERTAERFSQENEGPSSANSYLRFCEKHDSEHLAVGNVGGASSYRAHRIAVRVRGTEVERAWQAHVVDDAAKVVALRHAVPGDSFVVIGRKLLVLRGHDQGGRPVIALPEENEFPYSFVTAVVESARQPCPIDWRHPAFIGHAGRRMVETGDDYALALTLLAMRRAGHAKAFVKSAVSKGGTWTVDLAPVRTLADVVAEISRARRHCGLDLRTSVVQEHRPFVAEQRFFVIDGRIAASVCSARSFCAADALAGRMLDSRVARLAVPEIGSGAFDRGHADAVEDRALSARLARLARAVVADLRAEHLSDYVLDVGVRGDGTVAAIELNSLHRAGPYCLDRRLLVEAHVRARSRALARLGVTEAGPGALVATVSGRIRSEKDTRHPSFGTARSRFVLAAQAPCIAAPASYVMGRLAFVSPDVADKASLFAESVLEGWTPVFGVDVDVRRMRSLHVLVGSAMQGERTLLIGAAVVRRPWRNEPSWLAMPLGSDASSFAQNLHPIRIPRFAHRGVEGVKELFGLDDLSSLRLHRELVAGGGQMLVATLTDAFGRDADERRMPLPPAVDVLLAELEADARPRAGYRPIWRIPIVDDGRPESSRCETSGS